MQLTAKYKSSRTSLPSVSVAAASTPPWGLCIRSGACKARLHGVYASPMAAGCRRYGHYAIPGTVCAKNGMLSFVQITRQVCASPTAFFVVPCCTRSYLFSAAIQPLIRVTSCSLFCVFSISSISCSVASCVLPPASTRLICSAPAASAGV